MNANYNFIYIDVGCNGRISDGGVFRESYLCQAIDENTIAFPVPRKVGENSLPYGIVADDAFPPKQTL